MRAGWAADAGLSLALALALSLAPAPVVAAANPDKVLHVAIEAGDDGFDPARSTNYYSGLIQEVIFDRLLTYDYLAEPSKLAPLAAETLPEIGDGGKTYTFRIRKGIRFTPDPAFGGKPRELTAGDFAYSFKRFFDPRNASPWRWALDGKIVGLNALEEAARKNGDRFDYDAPVAGLELVDAHTLRIHLTEVDFNFAYLLASPVFSAVAREVIERYADDTKGHPVGSGPYYLAEWKRASRTLLKANAAYRGFVWDFAPSSNPRDAEIVAEMKGKSMPQIGTIEVSLIEEEQSRWLAFLNSQIDYIDRFGTFAEKAIPGNKVAPDLAKRGIQLYRYLESEMTYWHFNMQDPQIGGMSTEKIALRRAIALAYDTQEEIRVIRRNQAIKSESPIPNGVVGHDPAYRSILRYDPDLANKLLDYYGYKRGADGYRSFPDGKPLVIEHWSTPEAISREYDELWQKNLDVIGVRMRVQKIKFADLIQKGRACQMQMAGAAWTADWPTADNFLQLLYGPNVGQANYACYKSPQFDRLYVEAARLPDSPERNRLYALMTRQAEVDTAWLTGVTRYKNTLLHPWIKGYKKHPIMHAPWPYIDIDVSARPQ